MEPDGVASAGAPQVEKTPKAWALQDELPLFRNSSTTSALYSGVKCRRFFFFAAMIEHLPACYRGPSWVSTKAGQDHMGQFIPDNFMKLDLPLALITLRSNLKNDSQRGPSEPNNAPAPSTSTTSRSTE